MRIELVKGKDFVKEDGTYDLKGALMLSGKIAGECYNAEGFDVLMDENEEDTLKRIKRTKDNGHHSVYDHVSITMEFIDIPKMLAMVLNNEKMYTTSEKSLRYTKVKNNNGVITKLEEDLYNEWFEIYKDLITKKYSYVYTPFKIKTRAQENARYLVTVFIPTRMVHTVTLRQINLLAAFLKRYVEEKTNNFDSKNLYFEKQLVSSCQEFLAELHRLNVLDEGLMVNNKNRRISLFNNRIELSNEIFDELYQTTYEVSFASLAQAQRHRTLHYQMKRLEDKNFFVPPIIENDNGLVNKWLYDMDSVKELVPQGELVLVKESGEWSDFISSKGKERLCSEAQLETMLQTRKTLLKYYEALKVKNHFLTDEVEKYTKGARCTFCDFKCTEDCHFKEGKTLTRKI